MPTFRFDRVRGLGRSVRALVSPPAREAVNTGGPPAGALPDFVVIGAQKGGTTALYDLLTRHPLVEPSFGRPGVAPTDVKEVHFFDLFYGKGVGWYRGRFPKPRGTGARRTVTGEATPYYLFHPLVPERMARVIPEARLICLLRNPVDRAYSHFQQSARRGIEPLDFEAAVRAEEGRLAGEEERMRREPDYASPAHQNLSYLARGRYAEQITRWRAHFPPERMLALKSEDLFRDPAGALRPVLEHLGLPPWEPAPADLDGLRNEGGYGQRMDEGLRRRLEDYFEPHNRRLYDLLGVDFGW